MQNMGINRDNLIKKTVQISDPPHILKHTMTLAEKKRIQWQHEKGILFD